MADKVVRIRSVKQFQKCFADKRDSQSFVIANGVLRFSRALSLLKNDPRPKHQLYQHWSMVDGSVTNYSLHELFYEEGARFGEAMKAGVLFWEK